MLNGFKSLFLIYSAEINVHRAFSCMFYETYFLKIIVFAIIKVIGRQQDDNIWVFNDVVQLDGEGKAIPKNEQKYILLDDCKLPILKGIKSGLSHL